MQENAFDDAPYAKIHNIFRKHQAITTDSPPSIRQAFLLWSEQLSDTDQINTALHIIEQTPLHKLHQLAPRGSELEQSSAFLLTKLIHLRLHSINLNTLYKMLILGMRLLSDQDLDKIINQAKILINQSAQNIQSDALLSLNQFIKGIEQRHIGITQNRQPLKIAICVSGQMRNHEDAFKSWDFLGLEGHVVDYYVHTWLESGRRMPNSSKHAPRLFTGAFLKAFSDSINQHGFDYIKTNYPHFYNFLYESETISEQELTQTYQPKKIVIEDGFASEFSNMSNQQKMLYKMQKCYDLAKSTGIEYDLYIRIRPDKKLTKSKTPVDWYFIRDYCTQFRSLLSHGHTVWLDKNGLAITDQFAVANKEVFEIYSNTYNQTILKNGLEKTQNLLGFYLLADELVKQGVRIRKTPTLMLDALSDPPPLSAHMISSKISRDIEARAHVATDQTFMAALEQDLATETSTIDH